MGMGAGVWNKAFILAEMTFYEPVNIALPGLYCANYQNLASGVRSSKNHRLGGRHRFGDILVNVFQSTLYFFFIKPGIWISKQIL